MEPVLLKEIAGAVGSPAAEWENGRVGERETLVTAICTDSRKIEPGCVFVALKGPNFDGHDYVAAAFAGGAVAAIVERQAIANLQFAICNLQSPPTANCKLQIANCRLLGVEDTLVALGDVARWYRLRFDVPVVGITGSVGKTSTKEMVAAILGQRGPVVATQANFNNEIGLPLTLLSLESRHIGAVVELAMRGLGQIRYLADIARPRVGVVTNIGTSHLELLGSRENIARAKGEVLQALPADGAAVLPAADPFLPLLRELSSAPVTTFGFAPDQVDQSDQSDQSDRACAPAAPDLAVTELVVQPTESRFVLEGMGMRVPVRLMLPGRHNALNAAAAAAAARHAGATPEEIAAGLEAARLPAMRMRVFETEAGLTVLDDVYNASPQSVAAALDHLRRLPGQRHVAVLGDMLELGAESEAGHREVGQQAAFVDLLIAVGERARDIAAGARNAGLAAEKIQWCADAPAALDILRAEARAGDAVLVKASRGMRLETVVKGVEDA